jgi:1A family penicillin-binding protein
MSQKRKSQKLKTRKQSVFRFPTFRLPKISLPELRLKVRELFSNIFKVSFVDLPTKTKKKQANYSKLSKKSRTSRTSPDFLVLLKKYAIFLIKKIAAFIAFLFKSLWKGVLIVLSFLWFLIKKPFEFLNTLLTAQLRFFLLGVLICAIFFVAREFHQFVTSLPSPKEIGKVNYSLATQINDRDGKLLYEIYRDEKRTPIDISKLPKYVAEASIAIEDKDFYQHKGVSLVSGILRAGRETLFKGDLQGGSTITQQLVKTSLLTPERTITRKVKEIILALWTEQMYTKNQILQMYINQVPYGGAAYGIEEASKTYFGKEAKDLTIAEAALLAGLPQAPSDYSPFVNPKLSLNRRNSVLQKMKEQKYITESEYKVALDTPLDIIKPEVSIKAPHFVFYVKDQLEKQYGTHMVEEGGLKVTTTLDLDMQQHIQDIVRDEIAKQSYLHVSNGAVLVANPKTGEILAMVGSTDYFKDPNGAFNVTTAARQPGSSLKPLLYSLALQKGFTAASLINDTPTTFRMPGADPYHPNNYDGKFHGPVTMRIALANSYNIPAVKTLYDVGIQNFVTYMQNLGITTWNDPGRYVLPMAIGGVETKMVDEVTAYTALADLGQKVDLTGVKKLTDSNDSVLQTLNPQPEQDMSAGAAYIITDILSDNQARTLTFGPGSTLEIPGYKVAVKTGTTDSEKDNWAFGYTPEFLVGVWIGNNDNTPMSSSIESGATGASSLWHRVMLYLLQNKAQKPNEWYAKPDDVIGKICGGKTEYFIAGTENAVNCSPTPAPKKNSKTQPNVTQQPGQPLQTPAPTSPPDQNPGRRGNGNGNNGNRYNNVFTY